MSANFVASRHRRKEYVCLKEGIGLMGKGVQTKGCKRIKYVPLGYLEQGNYFKASMGFIQEKNLFVDTMDSQLLYKDKSS